MVSTLRAIQTYYNGHTFMSRLEARWAMFLDYCKAEWVYEPKRYDLDDGVGYLPDFLVHDVLYRDPGMKSHSRKDLYIEVKGIMMPKDRKKIESFGEHNFPLLVVGDFPVGTSITRIGRNIFEANDVDDYFYDFQFINGRVRTAYIGASEMRGIEIFDSFKDFINVKNNISKTINAFLRARYHSFR